MDTLERMWEDVAYELQAANSIAFDGCHKIYLQMDAEQTAQMVEYGYETIIRADEMECDAMLATLREWYEESCGLRFIQAVRTVEGNPNEGFTSLIPQGAEWEDEDEDEEED